MNRMHKVHYEITKQRLPGRFTRARPVTGWGWSGSAGSGLTGPRCCCCGGGRSRRARGREAVRSHPAGMKNGMHWFLSGQMGRWKSFQRWRAWERGWIWELGCGATLIRCLELRRRTWRACLGWLSLVWASPPSLVTWWTGQEPLGPLSPFWCPKKILLELDPNLNPSLRVYKLDGGPPGPAPACPSPSVMLLFPSVGVTFHLPAGRSPAGRRKTQVKGRFESEVLRSWAWRSLTFWRVSVNSRRRLRHLAAAILFLSLLIRRLSNSSGESLEKWEHLESITQGPVWKLFRFRHVGIPPEAPWHRGNTATVWAPWVTTIITAGSFSNKRSFTPS